MTGKMGMLAAFVMVLGSSAEAAPVSKPASPGAKGAPAAPPSVRLQLRLSKVVGHDGKAVGAVMRANRFRFQRCNSAGRAGTVKALFVIGTAGRVTWARSSGVSPAVAGCITKAVKKLSFPKPGQKARVIYRMRFGQPAGPRPKAGPHDGRNVRLRLYPGKMVGIDATAVKLVLLPNLWRLRKCSDGSAKHTVKARFSIGASGSIVYWSASGTDPTLSDCVASVLRGMRFPKGKAKVFYTFKYAPRG